MKIIKIAQIYAVISIGLCTSASHATVISYPNFSSTAGLTLVGNAGTAVTGDGSVLRLTGAGGGLHGAAYSTSAITLGPNATFSTSFQFRFTSPGGIDPADGITFVLAASPTGLGGSGVGMGYSGVPNSVAIEFDTYNNAGYGLGNNDGNSSNHISVDTNGSQTNSALSNAYGVSSCHFGYTFGCMSNGDLWTVTVGYDGSNLAVTVQDGAGSVFSAINGYPINIAAALGTNTAYVGFTAATGAGWENHDIVNWQFADTTELAHAPEPASLTLLGLGLAGLGFSRRKKA